MSLTRPVAPCPAPTVIALEAVPAANEGGAACWLNASALAVASLNAEHAEPRRAVPELQDHGAAAHGDARASVPRITEISTHCITCRFTRRTPLWPCPTVRSEAGEHSDAALARAAPPRALLCLGSRRSRVNANSLYRCPLTGNAHARSRRRADCLCSLRVPRFRGSAIEPTAPSWLLKSNVSQASGRAMTTPTIVALDNVPAVERPRCCRDPERLADRATRKRASWRRAPRSRRHDAR